jgi:hypothetical protein
MSPVKLPTGFRTKNRIKHTNPLCRVLLVEQTGGTVLSGVSETQVLKTRNTTWYSSQRFAISRGEGGGKLVRITGESGPRMGNSLVLITEKNELSATVKLLKAEILYLRV